ncbi:MAG: hypothetical protein O2894_10330 [Planctomycetota bacterium]|nr:hypothetical protein [Planctomycetota bacterium]
MRTHLYTTPLLFVLALFGFLLFGAALPTGGPAQAEESKDEGEKGEEEGDDDGGEFYEDETSFSGKEVTKAIDKGVSWLLKKQGRNGSWGGTKGNATYGGGASSGREDNPAGPTALALYALLKCKQPLKDPRIRNGFDWLHKNHKKPDSSYEVSAVLLAVCATADNTKMSKSADKAKVKPKLDGRYRSWATSLAKDLADMRTARGWRYNHQGQKESAEAGGPEDLSSTQLALLALFAAERLGIKTPAKVWEDALSFSLEQQEADGPDVTYQDPVDPKQQRTAQARGFAYIKGRPEHDEGGATGGMTACGIANIEMCRYVLTDAGRKREQWNKRDDAEKVQKSIFDGLAWLEKNWSPFNNPAKRSMNIYHVYWLYALERAMDLLSLRLVGSHNWYNEMGQELLNRQNPDGHWKTGSTHEPGDTLDTSFALLFLKRATKGSIPFGSVTGGSEDPPSDNR